VAARHGTAPARAPPLSLPLLVGWRVSCDGLATSLDAFMYNELRRTLRRSPWYNAVLEALAAPEQKITLPLRVGDRGRIKRPSLRGRIVELRGPLSPGGVEVCRVRYRGRPNPARIEAREDQPEHLPPEG